MAERLRIVLAGAAGAMPVAGVAWQVLHHLEGFRRLGHEVFYLEDTGRWPYDPLAERICDDASRAVAYVAGLMGRCGLERAWAYRDAASGSLFGCSERALRAALSRADVLVNLSGVTVLREEHLRVPVRVYLETDPVRPQIEIAQRRRFTIELLAAHTHHFTYGTNFGAPDCAVPLRLFGYQPTLPPVILDWWREPPHRPPPPPARRADGARRARRGGQPFTTVANWRQTAKDIRWRGRTLTWSKDVQFLRVLELPARVPVAIELALATEDERAVARLREAGWRVRAAGPLSKDLDAYRAYIRGSAGEFSVAKEQNVALRSGWFSDRTACYLAAGRPAIVQDTAFGGAIPTGAGLLTFTTLEDAVAAFEAVAADYPRHCAAAQELARAHLSHDVVLAQLLARLSATPDPRPRCAC